MNPFKECKIFSQERGRRPIPHLLQRKYLKVEKP
jgi:hypothetical protein